MKDVARGERRVEVGVGTLDVAGRREMREIRGQMIGLARSGEERLSVDYCLFQLQQLERVLCVEVEVEVLRLLMVCLGHRLRFHRCC